MIGEMLNKSICQGCGVSFEYQKYRIEKKFCSHSCYKKNKWNIENSEKINLSRNKWIEKYPDRRKKASSEYMKRNREYYNQYSSMYRYNRGRATPPWSDLETILYFYNEAEYQQMEVDHIIPLKHKKVCGLHVPSNLQLLTRSDNAKKSNKFKPFDEDILAIISEEDYKDNE